MKHWKLWLLWAGIIGAFCYMGSDAFADQPLVWNVPYVGTINLNLSSSEALLGYDAVLKQAIGGVSLPVWTDPKNLVALQVGAVAPWPTNNATVEPYVALGHDLAKEIPGLNQYNSIHLNVFARYATDQGKAGVGVSFSYSFVGSPVTPPVAPATAS